MLKKGLYRLNSLTFPIGKSNVKILTLLLLSPIGSEDPQEILKLYQSSKDLFLVIISALILLVLLQFQYKFWIFRKLIIGFNIFLILGYSIISLLFPNFQEKRLFWKVMLSIPISLLIIIALGFLPLDNLGILRLSASISIIAAILTYARRHIRLKIIKKSIKETITGEKEIISPSEAARIAMEQHEKIKPVKDEFEKTSPPEEYSKIGTYADLLTILILTIITIISPIKWPLEILFITLIPGYLLVTIIAPKKGINPYERLFLSFAASIILGAIINLTLKNPTLPEISCKISLILIIISTIIRSRIQAHERFYWNPIKSLKKIKTIKRLNKEQATSIILLIILFSMIGTTINIILNPAPGEKFTEFYILGPKGKAYDYPTNLTLNETGEVIMGVVNHEYQTTKYRIIVKLDEKIIDNTTITLKNGEKWEKHVKFTPTEPGDNKKLQFLLYRLPDEKKVYRSLHLFIDVNPPRKGI